MARASSIAQRDQIDRARCHDATNAFRVVIRDHPCRCPSRLYHFEVIRPNVLRLSGRPLNVTNRAREVTMTPASPTQNCSAQAKRAPRDLYPLLYYGFLVRLVCLFRFTPFMLSIPRPPSQCMTITLKPKHWYRQHSSSPPISSKLCQPNHDRHTAYSAFAWDKQMLTFSSAQRPPELILIRRQNNFYPDYSPRSGRDQIMRKFTPIGSSAGERPSQATKIQKPPRIGWHIWAINRALASSLT